MAVRSWLAATVTATLVSLAVARDLAPIGYDGGFITVSGSHLQKPDGSNYYFAGSVQVPCQLLSAYSAFNMDAFPCKPAGICHMLTPTSIHSSWHVATGTNMYNAIQADAWAFTEQVQKHPWKMQQLHWTRGNESMCQCHAR